MKFSASNNVSTQSQAKNAESVLQAGKKKKKKKKITNQVNEREETIKII